jgi:hypothetical protein
MNFCHNCQHARSTSVGLKCSAGHRIAWQAPANSLTTEYGFGSTTGCSRDFRKRRADYYETIKFVPRPSLSDQLRAKRGVTTAKESAA